MKTMINIQHLYWSEWENNLLLNIFRPLYVLWAFCGVVEFEVVLLLSFQQLGIIRWMHLNVNLLLVIHTSSVAFTTLSMFTRMVNINHKFRVCVCEDTQRCVPIKVMREKPVAVLNETIPVQQLLVGLLLIPHRMGRHVFTITRSRLTPVFQMKPLC